MGRHHVADGVGPSAPRVVEQRKVTAIVGDQNPVVLEGDDKLLVISGGCESQILSARYLVTVVAQENGKLQRNVVVKVKARHRQG